jgi:mating pheromone-induced death protein 2
MKRIALTVVFTLVFGLAALAQTQSSDQQGSSSPSASPSQTSPSSSPSQTSPSSSPSQTSPSTSPSTSQTPDMSAPSSGKQTSGTEAKGEKKLKGCIESQGGQYVLREKSGKEVALTGSADFASHVGHTVTVHGTVEKGGAGAMGSSSGTSGSQTSSAGAGGIGTSASSSGEQVMVSKIDHVSDTCKFEKGSKSSKSETGAGSSTTSPTSSKPDHQ